MLLCQVLVTHCPCVISLELGGRSISQFSELSLLSVENAVSWLLVMLTTISEEVLGEFEIGPSAQGLCRDSTKVALEGECQASNSDARGQMSVLGLTDRTFCVSCRVRSS